MYDDADPQWMSQALQWAQRGLYTTTPNPRVGCIVVKEGRVIGAGFTQPAGQAHAEIEALRDVSLRGESAHGATLYVTLEPCSHYGRTPPCTTAIVQAGIVQVVAAMTDPNPLVAGQGFTRLRAAGIDVRCGLLEQEAQALNPGFISRMQRGRPWLRLKMAASLDGRTGLRDGRSQWITGAAARQDGHRWRAQACAIMTGSGTVRCDNPALSVRGVDTPRQPRKILIDSSLSTPPEAAIFQSGEESWVFTAIDDATKRAALARKNVQTTCLPTTDGRVDLCAVLRELAHRGINELHVEAGPTLSSAFIAAGLADELLLYVAPRLLGDGQPMLDLPALPALTASWNLRFIDVRQIGQDIRLRAQVDTVAPGGVASV